MSRNEAQTRFDLIDPALRDQSGWRHPRYSAMRLEETARAIDIVDGKNCWISSTRRAAKLTRRWSSCDGWYY
jgi:hypothetical protein